MVDRISRPPEVLVDLGWDRPGDAVRRDDGTRTCRRGQRLGWSKAWYCSLVKALCGRKEAKRAGKGILYGGRQPSEGSVLRRGGEDRVLIPLYAHNSRGGNNVAAKEKKEVASTGSRKPAPDRRAGKEGRDCRANRLGAVLAS